MAEYDNTNSGALFENDKKQTSKHPDLRGQCTIKTPDGELVEYWVSAWQKTSKNGADFFSLSFQLKEDNEEKKTSSKSGGLFKKREVEEKPSPAMGLSKDLDDEVPF